MRYILLLLLIVFFGYAIGLVIMNNQELPINLLFAQSPAMNLGLLLILAIILGLIMGILLSVQLFKVIQNKWEIRGLKKQVSSLKGKLDDANKEIEHQKQLRVTPPVTQLDQSPVDSATTDANQPVQ